MRYLIASGFLFILLHPVSRAGNEGADFFNGKDLTGWRGLPGLWAVKDEAIIGDTGPDGIPANTFLCSEKEYKDFELAFQVKLTGDLTKANSGVQIRSELLDKEKFTVKGPQCDMGQVYWGSLYGEQFGGMMQQSDPEVVKKVLKPGEFNDYSIRCVGKRVTIKLNGETTVDAEFEKMPSNGIIAFQAHTGPAMVVVFKSIRFQELK